VLTYIRRDATEEFLITINTSNRPYAGIVPVNGQYEDVTPALEKRTAVTLPALSLNAWEFRIYRKSR